MNKELEEAIKILKRRNQILKLKYAITNEDLNAIEIVLNYIDNSIPKEVIEEKIEYYNDLIKECKNDEEHCGEIPLYKHNIQVLKELLEGK